MRRSGGHPKWREDPVADNSSNHKQSPFVRHATNALGQAAAPALRQAKPYRHANHAAPHQYNAHAPPSTPWDDRNPQHRSQPKAHAAEPIPVQNPHKTMTSLQKPAIVLLSGGIDSTTTLAIAKQHYPAIHALSFDYNQRHHNELGAAKAIAQEHACCHHIIRLPTMLFRDSALTDPSIALAKGRHAETIKTASTIPNSYVPARNNLFLAYALCYAESHAIYDIFIGVTAIDYSGYPDCRPAFIKAWQKTATLATKASTTGQAIRLHTPLIKLEKHAIIKKGLRLGVNYAKTWSCYDPTQEQQPCQQCDSCVLRAQAFTKLNMPDPSLSTTHQ